MREPSGRLVWDWPTRVFHWVLVISLAGSWLTADLGFEWTQWHFYLGYTALGLITFRLLWGFLGTRHARFSKFLRGPLSVFKYAVTLPQRESPQHAGHNPLGGWMVILLLLLVAVQATTGLFLTDDIFYSGPYNGAISSDLSDRLSYIHDLNFRVLQGAAALHIVAVIYYWLRKRNNLTAAMFTGRKPQEHVAEGESIKRSRTLLALVLALVVAGGVFLLVWLAPPPALVDFY